MTWPPPAGFLIFQKFHPFIKYSCLDAYLLKKTVWNTNKTQKRTGPDATEWGPMDDIDLSPFSCQSNHRELTKAHHVWAHFEYLCVQWMVGYERQPIDCNVAENLPSFADHNRSTMALQNKGLQHSQAVHFYMIFDPTAMIIIKSVQKLTSVSSVLQHLKLTNQKSYRWDTVGPTRWDGWMLW